MLSNLVYVSQRDSECSDDDIRNILDACVNNNKKRDITGVLLYSPSQFVQYLEGDFHQIYSLYKKIKTDPRHHQVLMISSSHIEERAFPSWQMGAKKISGEIEFISELDEAEKEDFAHILDGKEIEANRALHLMSKFFR